MQLSSNNNFNHSLAICKTIFLRFFIYSALPFTVCQTQISSFYLMLSCFKWALINGDQDFTISLAHVSFLMMHTLALITLKSVIPRTERVQASQILLEQGVLMDAGAHSTLITIISRQKYLSAREISLPMELI